MIKRLGDNVVGIGIDERSVFIHVRGGRLFQDDGGYNLLCRGDFKQWHWQSVLSVVSFLSQKRQFLRAFRWREELRINRRVLAFLGKVKDDLVFLKLRDSVVAL